MKRKWFRTRTRRAAEQPGTGRTKGQGNPAFRPTFEELEERLTPATVLTWTGGGGDNLWSNPLNWKDGGGMNIAPQGGEELVFKDGGVDVDPTSVNNSNDLATNIFIEKITFSHVTGGSLNFVINEANDGDSHRIQIGAGGLDVPGLSGQHTVNLPIGVLASGAQVNVAGLAKLTLGGAVSGSGTLTKTTNFGDLELAADNSSFSGQIVVNGGDLIVTHSNALGAGGSAANGTVVNKTGANDVRVVLLGDGINVGNEVLTLNGFEAELRSEGGINSWAGNISLGVGEFSRNIVAQNGRLTLSGSISSAADADGLPDLRLQGAGTVVYAGTASNTHAGETVASNALLLLAKTGPADAAVVGPLTVHSGSVVRWGADHQIADTAPVSVEGAQLDLNHFDDQFGALTLDAATVATGAGHLSLGGDIAQGTSNGPAGASLISGNLELGSANRTIDVTNTSSPLEISATVSGGDGFFLNKQGDGKLILSGANTFGALLRVLDGTVTARSDGALGAGGSLQTQTTVFRGAVLELEGGIDVADELLVLGSAGTATGPVLRNVSGDNSWGGEVNLSSPSTFNVLAGNLTVSGDIVGTSNNTLTKFGAGRLILSGDNGYSGDTLVNQGALRIESNTALGLTTGDTTVASGAALEMAGGINVGEDVTLNGTGLGGTGALRNVDGNNTWAGPVELDGLTRIGVDAGQQLSITGVIDGASTSPLLKVGSGKLVLTAANEYDGSTTVSAGTLNIQTNGALGSTLAGTTVHPGATLELEGNFTAFAEQLTLSGSGFAGGGALHKVGGSTVRWPGTVTLSGSTTVNVDTGGTLELAGVVSGPSTAGLTKTGGGTLTLTANNPYNGNTLVEVGTLLVNGAQPGSPVTVSAEGVLGGTGTTGPITMAGGIISPGTSAGTLTADGSVVFNGGSKFAVELNGVGTPNHDQLHVVTNSSLVALGGADLDVTLNFDPAVGQAFVIVSNDGTDPVIGTFAQGNSAKVRTSAGIATFDILYNASLDRFGRVVSGNDVVLRHRNTAPTFVNRSVTSPVNEGDTVTLTGTIVDPDPLDTFFLDVDWGDGVVKTFEFGPGANGTTVNITHTYEDENEEDLYVVKVAWRDGHEFGNSVELPVVTHNVAPTVDAGGLSVLREGGVLHRDGSFTDPGADTWAATVDYGDGTVEVVKLKKDKTFKLQHKYPNEGIYTVTVTVADDDGGVDTDSFDVAVLPKKGPPHGSLLLAVAAAFGGGWPGGLDTLDWDALTGLAGGRK